MHGLGNVFLLLLRNNDIAKVERQSAAECHAIAKVLDVVKELGGTGHTAGLDHLGDDIAKRFLGNNLIYIANLFRHILVEQHTSHRSVLLKNLHGVAVFIYVVNQHTNGSVKSDFPLVVGNFRLLGAIELRAFTFSSGGEAL